jgi:hypothetical protein
MMSENKMSYRGSKSILNNIVKEQRVDGSLCFCKKHIRCTLMGSEKNYQIKILSKQLNKNKNIQFSTLTSNSKLNS